MKVCLLSDIYLNFSCQTAETAAKNALDAARIVAPTAVINPGILHGQQFFRSHLHFLFAWSILVVTHLPCVERVPKPSVKGGFSRLWSCGVAFGPQLSLSGILWRLIRSDQLQVLETVMLASPLGKDDQIMLCRIDDGLK